MQEMQETRRGFGPWVRKISWRRTWQSTSVFLPGKSHGQRRLAGYSPWGRKEADTTEVTEHTLVSKMSVLRSILFHLVAGLFFQKCIFWSKELRYFCLSSVLFYTGIAKYMIFLYLKPNNNDLYTIRVWLPFFCDCFKKSPSKKWVCRRTTSRLLVLKMIWALGQNRT